MAFQRWCDLLERKYEEGGGGVWSASTARLSVFDALREHAEHAGDPSHLPTTKNVFFFVPSVDTGPS